MDGISQIIDGLATRYAAMPGEGEIERARRDFDGRRGKVYDDDDLYQTHMTHFLEWYALERVSVTPAKIPVLQAQKKPGRRILRVNYLADRPIEITEIKASHPGVKVSPLKNPPRSSLRSVFAAHTMNVMIPAWNDLPEEGAIIEVHTNDVDPKFRKFVVPVEKRQRGKASAKPKPVRPTVRTGTPPKP